MCRPPRSSGRSQAPDLMMAAPRKSAASTTAWMITPSKRQSTPQLFLSSAQRTSFVGKALHPRNLSSALFTLVGHFSCPSAQSP